ncbi:MAG: hypothetical protein Q4F41_08050 [Eubacteriales bacterium]|nr:hypothetical protein [Eubacteriales bacterium]
MYRKIAAVTMAMVLSAVFPFSTYAEETEAASTEAASAAEGESSAAVASASDMAPAEELDDSNLVALTAADLNDGTYEISVDSSSSMFKITACSLEVKDGEMTAAMTLGGTGYLYVYMGTGEEAAAAPEEDYIGFEEDENGAYVYTVSIEELNAKTDCAAFSKKKEMWYDRILIFEGNDLPKEAFAEEAKYEEIQASLPKKSEKKVLTVGGGSEETEAKETEATAEDAAASDGTETPSEEAAVSDGTYTIAVTLGGGSGKSTVTSPCKLEVKDGVMTATIEWSSPYYDYMLVDGEKYEPVNTEGNSVFEIPVSALDEELAVTADTTAMSEPHEIDYTLTFDSASMTQE